MSDKAISEQCNGTPLGLARYFVYTNVPDLFIY